MIKNTPANEGNIRDEEMRIGSLGWDDPLEEGMATHTSILAWKIPRTEEPGGLQSMGSQRVRHGRSDLACSHRVNLLVLRALSNPTRNSPEDSTGCDLGQSFPSCLKVSSENEETGPVHLRLER